MSVFAPEWMEKIMGEREREIINPPSSFISNYDEDYPDNRLPIGSRMQHIKSDIGCFTIDSRRKMIIS